MAKRRRGTARWWAGVAGVAITCAAAAVSEFWGAWYSRNPSAPSDYFAFDRSSVSAVWFYKGGPGGVFTGSPVMNPGWTFGRPLLRGHLSRRWLPHAAHGSTVGSPHVSVVVPLWLPLLGFAGLAWWGWRAGMRLPAWCCRACGYDLRGVECGKCPECGRGAQSEVC